MFIIAVSSFGGLSPGLPIMTTIFDSRAATSSTATGTPRLAQNSGWKWQKRH